LTEAAAPAQGKASPNHRLMHVVMAIVVVVVLPAVLMAVVVGPLGVSAMFVGLILGVFGSKLGGTQRVAVVSTLIGIAAGLVRSRRMTGGGLCCSPAPACSPASGSASGGSRRC
jgi:hypothetical protein